ncbi:hypothetical protein Tco_0874049 [Tanacetum coccineum]|uniref:Synaptobrevin, longin-like domain protein n=1 Tax=Tanacetum coccineum TaxID=301880 RepID=A0ABQ5BNG5_9ASTR
MNQTQGNSKEVGTPRYLSLVVPLRKVGDEAVHKELGDRMERAATTASSSEAEQDSGSGPRCQDTILGDVDAQTRFETTSEQSNDPPLSKVNTFRSGEDNMKILELMDIVHNCLHCPKFAETHNVVAFLEKPAESDGFAEIIDFLKASSVSYALTVNPIIYTSCIQQFWATAQVKTVNEVRQLQALIDKKKVIITEARIRNDLYLDDAEGTGCLPNTTIFEELAKMGYEKLSQKLTFYKAFFSPQWKFMIHTITQSLSAKTTTWNEFNSTMASLIICLATNRKFNMSKYVFDALVKHLDGGVKFLLEGKDFSGRVTSLFDNMLVQATEEKKQKSRRKQRKEAETVHAETEEEEHLNTPYNDLLPSGEDSMQLNELMALCTQLQKQVLDLEKVKSDQAVEIASFKKRPEELNPLMLFFGDQEDASKQGRSIEDIDADAEVTLVNEQQNEDLMFDIGVLDDDEVFMDVDSSEKNEQSTKIDDSTVGEVTAAKIDELTLAQTLIEIKATKPKVVTTTATTTTRPKGKGVVVREPSEFRVPQESQPSVTKDKGKGIMVEPEVPLKRKDQIALDEQIARDVQAKLDAELEEEQKLARKQEEEANIALIESWENTRAMMEADRLLAERL